MSKIDNEYHQLLDNILEIGYKYPDPNRKGVERLEIPSYTFRHEFKDGFPAISTKKLHYKNVVTELLWFLKGDTNIKYLIDNGCNIWNKDGYKFYLKNYELYPLGKDKMSFEEWLNKQKKGYSKHSGDLGAIYSAQWRNWKAGIKEVHLNENPIYIEREYIDQISNLIQGLKNKPLGTEHIVMAWNPADKPLMALPPCHYGFQIVVKPLTIFERNDIFKSLNYKNLNSGKFHGKYLDDLKIPRYGFELHWNQRSVDTFLGLPYNVASYATLALIIEKLTGYKALAIQGDLKKVHLYDNSIDAVKEQLSRDPNKNSNCNLKIEDRAEYYRIKTYGLETCSLDNLLSSIELEDFKLENYESYPAINVEMKERDE